MELFLLLFADDVTMFSNTIGGIQKQMCILKKYCEEAKLEVDIEKTKVVVFKNGGRQAKKYIRHDFISI